MQEGSIGADNKLYTSVVTFRNHDRIKKSIDDKHDAVYAASEALAGLKREGFLSIEEVNTDAISLVIEEIYCDVLKILSHLDNETRSEDRIFQDKNGLQEYLDTHMEGIRGLKIASQSDFMNDYIKRQAAGLVEMMWEVTNMQSSVQEVLKTLLFNQDKKKFDSQSTIKEEWIAKQDILEYDIINNWNINTIEYGTCVKDALTTVVGDGSAHSLGQLYSDPDYATESNAKKLLSDAIASIYSRYIYMMILGQEKVQAISSNIAEKVYNACFVYNDQDRNRWKIVERDRKEALLKRMTKRYNDQVPAKIADLKVVSSLHKEVDMYPLNIYDASCRSGLYCIGAHSSSICNNIEKEYFWEESKSAYKSFEQKQDRAVDLKISETLHKKEEKNVYRYSVSAAKYSVSLFPILTHKLLKISKGTSIAIGALIGACIFIVDAIRSRSKSLGRTSSGEVKHNEGKITQ